MLSELIEAGRRFEKEGKLDPAGYKKKSVKWIVHFSESASPTIVPRISSR